MRCLFVKKGRIVASKEVHSQSEQEAVEIGKRLFEETGAYDGLEVWDGSRRVFRMGRVSRRKGRRRSNPQSDAPIRTGED